MTPRPRAAVLSLLLLSPLLSFAQERSPELLLDDQALDSERDRVPRGKPAEAATSDCPVAGATDPDGVSLRLEVSRGTRLFAASHPLAAANPAPIDAQGDVKTVFRPVNYVDDEIFGAMDKAGVAPAPLSSDAEFLRRVTLDLTGRIPDAAAVASFLADTTRDKRDRMIDALLSSDAFNDRWVLFFDDLYRNTAFPDSGPLYPAGRNAFHDYFVTSLRGRKPYDQIVRELITGGGDNTQPAGAPGNFEVRNIQANGPAQDTYDNLAATTGAAFLGMNAVFCTSCHNGAGHLDQINLWGSQVLRQDFWGMSAFFSRTGIRRTGTTFPNYTYTITEASNGDYNLNTTTGNKTPRVPCTATLTTGCWPTDPAGLTKITPKFVLTGEKPKAGETYRAALARMVTSDPQFAKATVNYLWKELFTLGIVEPADAFDLARQDTSNPPVSPWTIQPTHPNLLKRLGTDLAASGFDLRTILRTMVRSNAYQLSSLYPGTWSEAMTPYFARHFVRRLGSEMLYDALTKATAVPASMPVTGYASPVAMAVQLPDVVEPGSRSIRTFLDTFLRGDRDSDPRTYQGSISQALTMLNDTNVTSRIKATASGSAVNKLISQNASPDTIVRTLYLGTLSRPPSAAELARSVALFSNLGAGQSKTTVAEDLQFALLNKLDFLFKY